MDMLWPPGDLAISISAHNSETEPEPRVLMGRNSEKRPRESIVLKKPSGTENRGRLVRAGARPVGDRRFPLCYPNQPFLAPYSMLASYEREARRSGSA